MNKTRMAALAMLLTLVVAACGGTATDDGVAELDLGIALPIAAFYPIYVAMEEGFYEEENLDIELHIFRGGPEQLSVMLSGEIDVGTSAFTEVMTAAEQGAELTAFWPVKNQADICIMSGPEYTTLEDLEGATFGISARGGLWHFSVEQILTAQGFDTSDISYAQLGGEVLEAIETGAVEAGAAIGAIADLDRYVEGGYVKHGCLADYFENFPVEVFIASDDVIEQEEAVLERLVRATDKGAEWLRDAENRDRAIEILQGVTGMDAEIAEAEYDAKFALQAYPVGGEWAMSGMEQAMEFQRAQGELTVDVDVEDLIDRRFTD